MFYFDELYGEKILRSDYIEDILAFFTTRETNEDNLFQKLGVKRIIRPEQTHSCNVEIVDERQEYKETDGLILTNNNTAICLKFADCTPLIFYDKKHKIAACSHAGWRGTAQKIAQITAEKMKSTFQTEFCDLVVLIGPAISKCCYEVSEDVKFQLLKTVNNKTDLFTENFIDLKNINKRQLEEIGVKNIDVCPYCTSCNNDLFYSYRKENGTEHRHKAVVVL